MTPLPPPNGPGPGHEEYHAHPEAAEAGTATIYPGTATIDPAQPAHFPPLTVTIAEDDTCDPTRSAML